MSDLGDLTSPPSDDDRTVHQRMADAIAALSYIPKGSSDGVKYEFRGIDAVMNHLHPVLAANGLFLAPRVLDDWRVQMIPGTNNREQTQAIFRVCVDVYGADGGMVTLGPGLAQSHDYGDKAVYQAQQNAVKYVLLEAFCIPTAEQDMDGREADPVPSVNLGPLHELIGLAKAAGLSGDYDGTVEWASQHQSYADKACSKLREALAAHNDDSSDGDHGEGSPAEDDSLEAPGYDASGVGTPDQGEPGAPGVPPAPSAPDPDLDWSKPTDDPHPPDADGYDVLAHCEVVGVAWARVIGQVIADWPNNDLAARPRPTRKALVALVKTRPEMVDVVRSIVDDLAGPEAGAA